MGSNAGETEKPEAQEPAFVGRGQHEPEPDYNDMTIAEYHKLYPRKERSYRKPHRCNRRLEDCLDAFGFSEWSEVRLRMGLFWRCVRSEVGGEPTDQYGVKRKGGRAK